MKPLRRNDYIGRSQNLDLYGVTIVKSKRHTFIDTEGHEYIDFLSAASSLPLGYQRKDFVKAWSDQCAQVPHTCTVYTFVPVVHEFAKRLAKTSKIPGAKVIFGAFGSDSVDAALKCAQAFTKKKRFIGFKKAYHGGTFLSFDANGLDGLKDNLHLPKFFTHIDYPSHDRYEQTLRELEDILKQGDVAGLLMETILGDGGVILPHSLFYKKAKELLHRYGALLILDEIQTGIGRTGTFWGYEQFGIIPDLFISAKALGAGYVSLSACIGRPEIIDALYNCQHAFTLSAHPAACAVGLRLLDAIKEEKVLANVKKIHRILVKMFQDGLKDSEFFDEVRGEGLMLGLVLKGEQSMGPHIGKLCLKNGVYIGYYGYKNNVLRIHPHLNIDERTARRGAQKVIDAILEFERHKDVYLKANEQFLSFFSV